jgi:glutathione S-transferase
LKLAHEQVDAGGKFGGFDTADFLATNPHGRVPVIRDGDVTVWESHAILRYLAARYGAEPFWSADPVARTRVSNHERVCGHPSRRGEDAARQDEALTRL